MTRRVRVPGGRAVVLGPRADDDRTRPDDTTELLSDPPKRYAASLRDLIPTPLMAEQERRAIEIIPVPRRPWWRGAWSLALIAAFFFGRLLTKWTGRFDEQADARKARQLFERLSGMWIKLGQLLSLKTDILTDAMCRELSALQYEMRGFPSDVAMDVLAEDLGAPITRVFARIEAQPFAAASICQVHRGILLDGDRAVVVKIMRPDVRQSFESDLRLLRVLVTLINILGQGGRLNLDEGLRELSNLLREETDYSHEVLNLHRMRKRLKSHGVIVPRVFPRISGRRVLVMEEIPGVLMSEYIRQRRENLSAVLAWERRNGVDPGRVARLLLTTTMRQILEDNQFHGDLHPGNIILLADNRIALIDFGTVGQMRSQAWLAYREMTSSIAMGDYERAADYMLLMSSSVPAFGVAKLRTGLADIIRQWEARSQLVTLPYSERSMGSASVDMARLMAVHKVAPTWALLRVGRALGTLDASLQVLSPDGNFMRLYKAYFRDRQKRRSSLRGRISSLQTTIGQMSKLSGDMQVLLLPQIRQQALRLRGMAGGLTRVKLSLLNVMRHGAMAMVGFALLGLVTDEYAQTIEDYAHGEGVLGYLVEPVHWFNEATPNLHYLHWLLIAGGFLFVTHVLAVVRRSMASRD